MNEELEQYPSWQLGALLGGLLALWADNPVTAVAWGLGVGLGYAIYRAGRP